MKSHTIKLKQNNMMCYRCLLNIVQGLSQLKSIQELDVDLDSKRIKIIYSDSDITKEDIQRIINDSIEKGVRADPKYMCGKTNTSLCHMTNMKGECIDERVSKNRAIEC